MYAVYMYTLTFFPRRYEIGVYYCNIFDSVTAALYT